ncbi:ribonuclease D [Zavarzinia compransoris]|uniref:ribonuclease D n=1 Tax=Zavarzinia marina TaxID=2911065 RepID=UPI001F267FCB|nr:ribonuclease D [Zavarzinia marina]MCF4164468.1 ribonuclease D [Zavarzinia marina]
MAKGFLHITDTEALTALVDRLKKAEYVTVDTEFLRDNTYWPKLCLVQVAGPDVAAIIDPLAPLIDLQPLLDLMADPNVLKVFHAARQDIEIFLKISGRIPEPLFDTQVAAMVCGYGDSVSYETLVSKIARASLDKSSRFTDWTRRPLTDRQLQYAIGDVTHLRKVYDNLAGELERSDRTEWLDEEMAILMDPATYIVEPRQAFQRIKTRTTNRRFLAILREVAAWRETEARARDLPRGRLLKDDALLELAAHPPHSIDEMKQSRGVPKGFADGKLGPSLLEAVRLGLECPDEDLPEAEKPVETPRGVGPLVELLKVMLKLQCERHGVAQKLVANTADLERIAGDDEADVPALSGWRRQVFGEAALALKTGKLALAAEGRRIKLIRLDE